MHLVFASDHNYLMQLAVGVRSALQHAWDGQRPTVTVLGLDLDDSDKARLTSSWRDIDAAVRFVDLGDDSLIRRFPVAVQHISSAATFARLLIPEVVPPDVGRVLYIDADTVTLSDLEELWRTDLKGRPVGAVTDLGIRTIADTQGVARWKHYGLDPSASYLNAGVLLMDLDELRRRRTCDLAMDYLAAEGEGVKWADQEALNAVLAGDYFRLDPAWNTTFHWFIPPLAGTSAAKALTPKIRHFAGAVKPWSSRDLREWRPANNTGEDRFFASLEETDWRGWTPPEH